MTLAPSWPLPVSRQAVTGWRPRLLAALAIFAWLAIAAPAESNLYYVFNCGSGVGHNSIATNAPESDIYVEDRCLNGGYMQTVQRVETNGWSGKGWWSAWSWRAPDYTSLVKVTGTSWGRWSYSSGASDWSYSAGTRVVNDSGASRWLNGSGVASWSGASIPSWDGSGQRWFQAIVSCRGGEGSGGQYCKQGTTNSAYASVAGLTFHLSDYGVPGASLGGGLLSGGWKSGPQGVSYSGWEPGYSGSGVRHLRVEVNGSVVGQQDFLGSCNTIWSGTHGTTMQPCPGNLVTSATLDTGQHPFQEGANSVRACAIDYSGNYGCGGTSTVHIDRSAPAGPMDLALAGGSDWRSGNSFTVGWNNPGDVSGIAGARYRITRIGGGYDSGAQYAEGAGRTSLTVGVPSAGAYTLRTWLQDGAGYHDESSATSVTLRYDGTAPAAVTLTPHDGWISRADLPYVQTWEAPDPEPASGTAGYAVVVDRSSGTDPGASITHSGRDNRSITLAGLDEGVHYVHVAAISGSGVRGTVAHLALPVDTADPGTAVSGVPDRQWVNDDVALRLAPADPRPVNGADPSGVDRTEIEVDGIADTVEGGSGDTVGIEAEGEHTVVVKSVDRAGNPETAQRISVRIDRTPPVTTASGIGAAEWAADDVKVVLEAADALSGTAGLRWSLDGAPEQESTSRAALELTAEGAHVLRYHGLDRAGNVEEEVVRTVKVDKSPPQLTVDGVPDGWTNADVAMAVQASDAHSGMTPGRGAIDDGPFTAVRLDGGTWRKTAGDQASLAIGGEGVHSVSYYARDVAGKATEVFTRPVRIDRTPPSALFAAEQDPLRPEEIRAGVADSASGVAGGTIQYRKAGTSEWKPLATTLIERELVAHFPSEELDHARYEFRVEVFDAAGNRAVSTRRGDGTSMVLAVPIKVETGVEVSLGDVSVSAFGRDSRACVVRKPKAKPKPKPKAKRRRAARRKRAAKRPTRGRTRASASAPVELLATSTARVCRPARSTADYLESPLVSGTLRTKAGTALMGRDLKIVAEPVAGSTAKPYTRTVTTDGAGRFRLALPAGPSRTVRVEHAGSTVLGQALTPPLDLRTRGRVSLKIAPRRLYNGGAILMTGRIGRRLAKVPEQGKLVEIQFYDTRSRIWRPVKLVRTNRSGRFRYRYRFRHVLTAQRIRFRAALPAEAGWPYAFAASRSAWVAVYPR